MKLFHNYYTYIVQCSDESYYTGITNDLERRILEHNNGEDSKSYTYNRRPVVLRYYEHSTDVNQAIAREKQLKGWTRKKKEALFEQDFELLAELSKSKQVKVEDKKEKLH